MDSVPANIPFIRCLLEMFSLSDRASTPVLEIKIILEQGRSMDLVQAHTNCQAVFKLNQGIQPPYIEPLSVPQ